MDLCGTFRKCDFVSRTMSHAKLLLHRSFMHYRVTLSDILSVAQNYALVVHILYIIHDISVVTISLDKLTTCLFASLLF